MIVTLFTLLLPFAAADAGPVERFRAAAEARKAVDRFAIRITATENGKPSYTANVWKNGAKFRMDRIYHVAEDYGDGLNNRDEVDRRQIFCVGYQDGTKRCHLVEDTTSLVVYDIGDNDHGMFDDKMLYLNPDPSTIGFYPLMNEYVFRKYIANKDSVVQDAVLSSTSFRRTVLPINWELVYELADPRKLVLTVFAKDKDGKAWKAGVVVSRFKQSHAEFPEDISTEQFSREGTVEKSQRIEVMPLPADDCVDDPFSMLGLRLKNGQVITTPGVRARYVLAYVDGKTIPYTQYNPNSIMRRKPGEPAGTPPVPVVVGGGSRLRWEVIAAGVMLLSCAIFFARRWWKS